MIACLANVQNCVYLILPLAIFDALFVRHMSERDGIVQWHPMGGHQPEEEVIERLPKAIGLACHQIAHLRTNNIVISIGAW